MHHYVNGYYYGMVAYSNPITSSSVILYVTILSTKFDVRSIASYGLFCFTVLIQ